MNRFLTVPLVLCAGMLALCFFHQLSLGTAGASRYDALSELPTTANANDATLLDLESAESLVATKIQEHQSNYRMMSRAMVMPAKVMTVKIDTQFNTLRSKMDEDASFDADFFLGTVTMERLSKQTSVPIAVDRSTRQIYVYTNSRWIVQENWNTSRGF